MEIGGLVDRSFYKSPKWSDQNKPAGQTSLAAEYGQPGWWHGYITGQNFIYTANGPWLILTVVWYIIFPYNLEAAGKGWALSWILPRVVLNVVFHMAWNGWWHFSLYGLGWGKRPWRPNRRYSFPQLFHNMWFTFLSILQWTAMEIAFVYMYGTGRLPYVSNEEFLSGGWGTLSTIFLVYAFPLAEETHFYWSHRVSHLKPIYKYMHGLHHRNIDNEPFAGLAMHPWDIMYYFSSLGICVFFRTSPFVMLWYGMTMMLYPACAHAGVEDTWNSDQFHTIHHRYFECNYGSFDPPLDKIFGTFRDKMGTDSTYYKGASEEDTSEKVVGVSNAKARLGAPESWDQGAFWMGTIIIYGTLYNAAAGSTGDSSETTLALKVALLVSIGPIIWATLLLALSSDAKRLGLRKMLLYPFHKEFLLGRLGLHCFFGVLLTLVPIYFTVATLLLPPGQGFVSSIYR